LFELTADGYLMTDPALWTLAWREWKDATPATGEPIVM
jgi:hypothetical protein